MSANALMIDSTIFGEQEIDPSTVVTFPKGMPGFEDLRYYKLFHEEGGDTVHWLQSMDDPEVALSVVDPTQLNIYYEVSLDDEECRLLDVDTAGDTSVMLIVYQPVPGTPTRRASDVNLKANVTGPIIINTKKRLALQKTLAQTEQVVTIRSA